MSRPTSSLAMAFVAITAVSQMALAAAPTPASGTTWEPNQAVQYRWKEGSKPPLWMRSAMKSAAADSNRSRRAKAAVFSYHSDASSWIGYTANIPTSYAIGYAVRNVPTSFSIRLRPQGYVLDWGMLRWCQFYEDPPNGCYDAEMVTLHELGHVQTLGHVDESQVEWLDSIMHASVHSKAKIGWDMHDFGRCDVARLQIRYEALTSATPYSTCLSLPTSLALGSSASWVSYGTSVTFRATLRVADDAPSARLAGDPVSGRRVLLQRRPVGGTSWSTLAEMVPFTDGSGRYSSSVKMTATYEWRARFPAPAGEGLRAASSTLLRVNVSDCTSTCPLGTQAVATIGGIP